MADTNAWEVWSHYPGAPRSDAGFVDAFKDKGEAKAKMRRLKASHPHVSYYVKRRKSPTSAHFGTRAHGRRGRVRSRR